MIPTEQLILLMLIVITLVIAGVVCCLSFFIILLKSLVRSDQYLTGIPNRFAAFMIDFLIIRIIHDNLYYVVWMAFFSGIGIDLPVQLWYSYQYYFLSFFTIFTIFFLLLPLDLVFYLFFPPLFIIWSSFTVYILAFGYFFIFGAFFDGRTIGKIVLKIKSVSGKEERSLTLKEAAIDALAKSLFLAWDIIIGALLWARARDDRKQIRLVHRLMKVEVINTKYVGDQLPSDRVGKSEELTAPDIFCTNCGKKIPAISRFCPYCGFVMENDLGE
ncbi:MAG: zinc-ribbon domain-containing protein [Candidatus Hermodarchaeota archaeon]